MALNKTDSFSAPPFWQNGPTPGAFYNFPGNSLSQESQNLNGIQRSHTPMVTGTSVLGMKFKDGVILAADMLGSYGALARIRNCERLMKVNDNIILGASGDYADFQSMRRNIEKKIREEQCLDDGFTLKPKSLHCWLTRIMYNKRSNMDPLWNTFVIGGLENGEPFLGSVDKLGTAYTSSYISNGYGMYIAVPLMRKAWETNPNMSKEEVTAFFHHLMEVLYYRDARSYPKYQYAIITKDGVEISEPVTFEGNWEATLKI